MRKPLIAGNWKMNGSRNSIAELLGGVSAGLAVLDEKIDVVVCPPFAYLAQVVNAVNESRIQVGGQDRKSVV